ncbi:MAG: N-acetylmuramoyl-L-alanine amidase [Flavobacteriia bacterium]|nr:N-acetylmuramoyl-L-alanine amidase [Flavobacteriia bacterium]
MKFLALIATLSLFGSAFALFDSPSQHLIIDAGHGGMDPGGSQDGIREADINLIWAIELKQLAEERGMLVTILREDDSFMDLKMRKAGVEDALEDETVFISIHQNTSQNIDVQGAFVYVSESSTEASVKLAEVIEAHLDSITDTRTQEQDLFLLRDTDVTGVVVSPGFMSNATDFANMNSKEFRSRFNHQLLNAIQK